MCILSICLLFGIVNSSTKTDPVEEEPMTLSEVKVQESSISWPKGEAIGDEGMGGGGEVHMVEGRQMYASPLQCFALGSSTYCTLYKCN